MKRWVLISVALLLVLALASMAGCATGVSQEDYDAVESELVAAQSEIETLQSEFVAAQSQIETLQSDLDSLEEIVSLEADCIELRNSTQIKWMRALQAVEKFEREMYSNGAILAETACERLDAFIADTEELIATEEELSNQVATEYSNVYEQSAKFDRCRVKEAAALKEEVQGRVLTYTVSRGYDEAYWRYRQTGELFTEEQREAWLSSLDEALIYYKAEARLLNEAIDIVPELTRYFDQKLEYVENYQREVSYLKDRIGGFPPEEEVPVPVPAPPEK